MGRCEREDALDQLEVLDRSAALGRVGGDLELLREVARIFLEEWPDALREIKQTAEAGDSRSLERAAHSLKGSIGNFGARAAFDAAYQVEMIGRRGPLSEAAEAIASLEAALEQLQPALAQLAAGPASDPDV